MGTLVAAALAWGLLAAAPAHAVKVDCGDVITEDTKVSNDLKNCPGNGLVIEASDVTLDLNGHTIDGDESGNGRGILIQNDLDDVIVKDGRLRQFRDGVIVDVNGNGHRLIGLRLIDNLEEGLEFTSGNTNSLVRNVEALGNVTGFRANGLNSGLLFERTTAKGSEGVGYLLEDVDDSVIARSSARGNGDDGIQVRTGSSGNLIRDFTAEGNSNRGVDVNGDSNTLLEIHALDNDVDGIDFDGPDNKLLDSTALKNGADGIVVRDGAEGTLLRGNAANDNDDGIHIDVGGVATLRRNTANDNDNIGIDNDGTVTDLGGNKAKGNGDQNCVNISCG